MINILEDNGAQKNKVSLNTLMLQYNNLLKMIKGIAKSQATEY